MARSRSRVRWRTAGAAMLACADIEEGIVLRRGGVRVPILVFGALSVSDLDGVFTHDLTPTISTPSAARALQDAAARHGVVAPLPPEDRHRHEPARIPPRQPRGLAFPRSPAARTSQSTPSTPTSPPLTIRSTRSSASSASVSSRRSVRLPALGVDCLASATPRTRAALLRDERVWYDFVRPGLLLYGIVPPPLAATIALRPALSLHEPHRRGQRAAARRGHRLRHEDARRPADNRCRRAGRLRRRPRPAAGRRVATCSSAAGVRRSSARCAWT